MTLPDNRIRFFSTKTDFDTYFGNLGQEIDSYPPEGGQARFDHMRAVLLGLLSQQSSYEEPSQKREGTPWLDLATGILKIFRDGQWVSYSEVISVTETQTLAQWFTEASEPLKTLSPEIVFCGTAVGTTATINVPESLRPYLKSDSRVFMYVNGLLMDPRLNLLEPSVAPVYIRLTTPINNGDKFVVDIRRVSNSTFYTDNV